MIIRRLALSVLALALAAPILLLSACGGGSGGEVTYTIADEGGITLNELKEAFSKGGAYDGLGDGKSIGYGRFNSTFEEDVSS